MEFGLLTVTIDPQVESSILGQVKEPHRSDSLGELFEKQTFGKGWGHLSMVKLGRRNYKDLGSNDSFTMHSATHLASLSLISSSAK